ncbi:B12-binding domain-containing radical SAM protein [Pelagibacteraceae bacterium]|nr:B12-binding domain-containing radical SAM protein [Pelagibacteraceae bacterium]
MARVLLINPPFYRLLGSHYNANSLGIAYIASYLNKRGHDAWLYNADYKSEHSYIKLKGIFSNFTNYKDYFKDTDNAIWHEVKDQIIKFKPEWVGYTSYTANISAIKIISDKVKQVDPSIKQVIGGVHATLDSDILNSLTSVDYSIQREGEEAFLALVEKKDPKKIPGVVSRSNNTLFKTGIAPVIKDINILPMPEREKFWGIPESDRKTVDVSYVNTIRGCPYKCTYCASPFHWDRKTTRLRTPESVMEEMRYLKEHHYVRPKFDYAASANIDSKESMKIEDNTIVYFVDDVFTVNKKRVKKLLRMMIDEKLDMKWKCEARADHLDDEVCELMAEAGCERVKVGFESGSNRILSEVKKLETREEMLVGAEMLKKAGVPFSAYFMTGFPGETDDDLKQTIDFAKKVDADYYSLSVLAPYYGTELYDTLMKNGHELDQQPWEYFFHQSPKPMVNNLLSTKVLEEYLALSELNKRGKRKKGYI